MQEVPTLREDVFQPCNPDNLRTYGLSPGTFGSYTIDILERILLPVSIGNAQSKSDMYGHKNTDSSAALRGTPSASITPLHEKD